MSGVIKNSNLKISLIKSDVKKPEEDFDDVKIPIKLFNEDYSLKSKQGSAKKRKTLRKNSLVDVLEY